MNIYIKRLDKVDEPIVLKMGKIFPNVWVLYYLAKIAKLSFEVYGDHFDVVCLESDDPNTLGIVMCQKTNKKLFKVVLGE